MSKIHMPLYTDETTIDDLDALRHAKAEEIGVSTISRGDYVTRLVREEKKRQEAKAGE